MKSILYERSDGGVSIVHPVYGNKSAEETEEAFLERIRAKDVPVGAVGVRIIDRTELPADRAFRNAWKRDLTVDMVRAREIHRNRLRDMRAPKLAVLDWEYMRADERGDTLEKQRIAVRKQALRDVTVDPVIGAAHTPEELKAAIPEALR